MDVLNFLVFAILTSILLAFWKIKKGYSYWKERNVPFIEPKFPYGTVKIPGKNIFHALITQKYYKRMKGKFLFCGTFDFIKPSALILDIELAKNILSRDFAYFHDRGFYYNEKEDPLSGHLFNLEGEKWRKMRNKLTATFTSGKIKFMFPTILTIGERLVQVLEEQSKEDNAVDMKEMIARFGTDVIANVAFGLECSSLTEETKFREMGRKVFEAPKNGPIKQSLIQMFKGLSRFFNVKVEHSDVTEFFLKTVEDTVRYREENNVERNDFLDILIKLRKEELETGQSDALTINQMAAQCFIFYLGGFETSSTAVSCALYELSMNQDLQNKARESVRNVLRKSNNQFTYEALQEMDYIEACINESLRKYPSIGRLVRTVTKDYQVSDTNITLEKGMVVIVPVYSIHHDPEFYPQPEKYDPDRFNADDSAKRNPYTFLPFGQGPRTCIALQYGMVQAKFALALLLNHFKFSLGEKTKIPLEFSSSTIVMKIEGGLWLNVEKMN